MKYTVDDIKLLSLFEGVTHAHVKDLFMGETPLFIIAEGQLGKALGRDKSNVLRLEHLLKKKVRMVEYSPMVLQFTLNMVAPLQIADIKQEGKIIIISGKDPRTNGLLIGRNAKIRVITEPQSVNLNSDQRPLLWAVILCAIS